MKKLVVAAAVLALSAGVNAQNADDSAMGFGGLQTSTITALGVSAAVAAAVISNNRGSSIDVVEPPVQVLVCNAGDGSPVNGVCTNTSNITTITASGTGTRSITVPVITTYPAVLQ